MGLSGFVLFSVMLSGATHSWGLDSCRDLTRMTWKLDLQKKSVLRLHQAEHAENFCGALPLSHSENVKLELVDAKGKVWFYRKIFLNPSLHFDRVSDDDQLSGGVQPEKQPIFTTAIPLEPRLKNSQLRIRLLRNGKLLAQGTP